MASSGGKVNWYDNDVVLQIEGATDEILTRLAFFIEGEAKARMNVDTGFMRNATYTVAPGADGRDEAQADAEAVAERYLAPKPEVSEHEAAVHAAAEYTIHQENQNPALYTALQLAQQEAPGVIREVGRDRL